MKDKTHWNAQNINPQNPVILGLCNEAELQKAVSKANKKKKKLEEIESK